MKENKDKLKEELNKLKLRRSELEEINKIKLEMQKEKEKMAELCLSVLDKFKKLFEKRY